MSANSVESRENSPNAAEGLTEKRSSKKRKVLSCYACRSRKMKCDRVFPVCGRCQKTGRADQCTYDPRLIEETAIDGEGHVDSTPHACLGPSDQTAATNSSADALYWRLRIQERRVNALEKKLASVDDTKRNLSEVSMLQFSDTAHEEPQLGEEIMFRGKAFKTMFTGTTSHLSAAGQFPELQSFTRQALALDGGNMHRVRNDFKVFRERKKIIHQEKSRVVSGLDDEIFGLLPEKTIVDQHVGKYFRAWETTYRILHETIFWKDYPAFWQRASNDKFAIDYAVTLLYMIAITKCDSPNEMNVFVGDSSADREDASNIVASCDAWLARQSRKQLTISFFQHHCLSIVAKRVNCLKLKQDWVSTGEVMRLALAAGLHRNPSLIAYGRITEYEKEMRRRLWVTIAELELQSSIDAGLQSSLCGLYFDVQPPANLPDVAISIEMPEMPAGRPIEHFTSTSYLRTTLNSLPLRVHLLQLLNNPTNNLQYSDVLHYDSQINSSLSAIPDWDSLGRAEVPSSLLRFQLQQFLLILHRPYARLATKYHQYNYSLTACVDASSALIASYETLVSRGLLALNHARNDILRVGITLSQAVYYNCVPNTPSDSSSESSAPNRSLHAMDLGSAAVGKMRILSEVEPKIAILPKNNYFTTIICTTALELLKKVHMLFEAKLLRLGTGYVEYWLLSSAIAFMPTSNQTTAPVPLIAENVPDELRARARNSMERMTSLCFRILALQKDPQNGFAAALRTTVVTPSPSTSNSAAPSNYSDNATGVIPPLIPGASGMAASLADEQSTDAFFNNLRETGFDPSGWEFTNFWDFDMDGVF